MSFLVANVGLDMIIEYAVPVLMFLYPLAITLILLGIFGNAFGHSRYVYGFVTGFTLFAAVFDFFGALPEYAIKLLHIGGVLEIAQRTLPFSSYGLGWIVPAAIGLLIGFFVYKVKKA